ncbi:MAG: fluoride efflux transporter CrcB [Actinomycetota bacterium]
MRALWIGIAGAAGALARYGIGGVIARANRGAFPAGTFVVNVSGCFLLGLVFVLLTERFLPHPTTRTALTVGFLGAYTTFSTFSLETVRLAEDGAVLLAAANVAGSVLAGLVAIVAGMWIGRAI